MYFIKSDCDTKIRTFLILFNLYIIYTIKCLLACSVLYFMFYSGKVSHNTYLR